MSLVLEALRRVEKTDVRTGAIGAAVPSYRPIRKKTSKALPLLLGLGAGGLVVFFYGPRMLESDEPFTPAPTQHRPKGRAGLPPPLLPPGELSGAVVGARPGTGQGKRRFIEPAATAKEFAPALFLLQAISERDGRPIAIINDRLVREGDLLDGARVVRIGSETVEVLFDNGQRDTVRFAPPPPEPTPSSTPPFA